MFARILCACLAAGFFVCRPMVLSAAQPPVAITVITTFDYPGAGNSTTAHFINSRGDCTGTYVDSLGVTRGFVRFANGSFSTPIVDPNDTGNFTFALGINTARLVCGYYLDTTYHGFFLSGHTYTTYNVPAQVSTFPLYVNDAGDFAGAVDDGTVQQGFVSISAATTLFSVPGALITDANCLNAANQVVGDYYDGVTYHGYLRAANGALTFPIDYPGSGFTTLIAMNDRGLVVGRYIGGDGLEHGLLLKLPHTFLSFDYPGASGTSLNGINNGRTISGRYTDASGVRHGFLARVQ